MNVIEYPRRREGPSINKSTTRESERERERERELVEKLNLNNTKLLDKKSQKLKAHHFCLSIFQNYASNNKKGTTLI